MNRRSFLAGLASLPISSTLLASSQLAKSGSMDSTLSPSSLVQTPTTKSFNVYFHGLFAFILTAQQYQVHVPEVDLAAHYHVYEIGSPTDQSCNNLSLCNLDPGGEYNLQLAGYTGSLDYPASFADALHIDPTKTSITMDYSFQHCYLELPATPNLQSLHRVRRNDGLPLFFGDVARLNNITSATLSRLGRTYRLNYSSPTPFTPTLVKTGGSACWTYSGQDLHIFAQPDHAILPTELDSTLAAFDRLRFMCGKLELFPTPFRAGTFTSIDRNVLCEEGLGERPHPVSAHHKTAAGHDGPIRGGETANCVALFVGP